jgi:GMP synthase (glutamine-hydrolysing)
MSVMDVLAVIHGDEARSGTFAPAAAAGGHAIEEWSIGSGSPPPRPLDHYGAVIVFGGAMHADQDDRHPWLREENFFIQRLLDRHVPTLGVCLGSQLIAKAAHAPVQRASEPEIGWLPVELTEAAEDDPLLGRLPRHFEAFQWHYYRHGVPAGGRELARSRVCTQAFRLGESAWGIQFHAEVTAAQVEAWIRETPDELPLPAEELIGQTAARIGDWNELGRRLCGGFVEVAERVGVAA